MNPDAFMEWVLAVGGGIVIISMCIGLARNYISG